MNGVARVGLNEWRLWWAEGEEGVAFSPCAEGVLYYHPVVTDKEEAESLSFIFLFSSLGSRLWRLSGGCVSSG